MPKLLFVFIMFFYIIKNPYLQSIYKSCFKKYIISSGIYLYLHGIHCCNNNNNNIYLKFNIHCI